MGQLTELIASGIGHNIGIIFVQEHRYHHSEVKIKYHDADYKLKFVSASAYRNFHKEKIFAASSLQLDLAFYIKCIADFVFFCEIFCKYL